MVTNRQTGEPRQRPFEVRSKIRYADLIQEVCRLHNVYPEPVMGLQYRIVKKEVPGCAIEIMDECQLVLFIKKVLPIFQKKSGARSAAAQHEYVVLFEQVGTPSEQSKPAAAAKKVSLWLIMRCLFTYYQGNKKWCRSSSSKATIWKSRVS